jgi:carboxyl-terminal processing protease
MIREKVTSTYGYILIVVGIVLSFGVGMFVGQHVDVAQTEVAVGGEVHGIGGDAPDYLLEDRDFQLFWDAWEIVTSSFVDQPVNETELLYGAIEGVINALGDSHSVLLTPDVNDDFMQELSGSFFGVGMEIAIKNGVLQVVSPLPGTPAERAGLRARDYIVKIDDLETDGVSLDYAVSQIRGEKGTDVTLTIFREGEDAPREVTITRDEIEITSVQWKQLDGGSAHVELRYFNEDTDREFKKIADEILRSDTQHIILDMRNNPGGLLHVAVNIASLFVEDGNIVTEKYFDASEQQHPARGRALLGDYPVTVLINEGSASASEIVAGALQDYGIATVIGEQSFGKGSVQTLFPLSDGSAIKLTIAKWVTPQGNTIEGEGITPDIVEELTTEDWNNDEDPQLQRAINEILGVQVSDETQ